MLDFLLFIYRKFKLSLYCCLLFFIYLVAYIDGYIAHAKNVYISEEFILEQQMKYTKAAYGISDSPSIPQTHTDNIELLSAPDTDLYNSIGTELTLNIEKLGIHEELFTFPMTYNLDAYDYINSKKLDPNYIDLELMNLGDIRKGFLIGGHSSGLWSDTSRLKKVFNGLDGLEVGDSISLERDDGRSISYEVISKQVKDLDESLTLGNRFYIYTCYPIGSNKQRLVIELRENN